MSDARARLRWRVPVAAAVCVASFARAEPAVPADVTQALIRQLRADVPEMRECRPASGLPVDAKALDLGDGQPAYLLTSISACECGQVNCSQWVYRRAAPGWTKVLETEGYRLSIGPGRHHGLSDLLSEARGSTVAVDHRRYSFDGSVYRPADATVEDVRTGRRDAASRRVRFAKGRDAATLTGRTRLGFTDRWVLGAREGQPMHLSLVGGAVFTLVVPATGDAPRTIGPVARWDGVLAVTGDYIILVDPVGDGPVDYTLDVGIAARR